MGVEVQTNDLCCVAEQGVNALPRLHVPKPRRVVHAPSRNGGTHGVETKADDLCGVSPVCVVEVSVVRVPQFAGLVETVMSEANRDRGWDGEGGKRGAKRRVEGCSLCRKAVY